MKILLVSDLHYALKQFDWTAAAAVDFDLVILAGDHLDIAGQLDGGVQIVVILNYLKRMAAQGRVIVSSGNHDLDTRDSHGEKVASWMTRVRHYRGLRDTPGKLRRLFESYRFGSIASRLEPLRLAHASGPHPGPRADATGARDDAPIKHLAAL